MKIFEETSQNFTVHIYTNDHLPAHVHIFKGSKKAGRPSVKINIGNENTPPEVIKVDGMQRQDVKLAWRLVVQHQEMFLKRWLQIHGFPKLD
jgi:Domain of unknown function (DUF4160)